MGSKIRLPTSEGGLVRYGDAEVPSLIKLKPETVIGICAVLIILTLLLNVYGPKFF